MPARVDAGPRPITARALTSAIDSLRPKLMDASVLELYAGHGRFAERALEEGAAFVLLVEKDRKVGSELKQRMAKYPAAEVRITSVESYLAAPEDGAFDIIFADPPFPFWAEKNFETDLLTGVARRARIGTVFLVKYPKRVVASQAFSSFVQVKSSVFGESKLVYFVYGESSQKAE